jgi:tRNA threonylcarbamoyladenosine biosynthesis protein TsaB
MQILALDASTDVCAVALGDGAHWAERAESAGQRHSELLLPMVRALLAETRLDLAALDGIAFGAGPGSFTGLRIACGVAQGLALGANLPVVGIATLEAMAETARQKSGRTRVIAALDARMLEVYVAAYEHDGLRWRAVLDPVVVLPAEAPLPPGGGWTGVGNGFAAYPALRERFGGALAGCDESILPTAIAIGTLALPRFVAGEGIPARDAAPLYIRHRVALTTAERAAGMRL